MRFLLNFLLLVCALVAGAACLWVASFCNWYWGIMAIFLFAHINQLPFAMMHEAVHGVAAFSKVGNRCLGIMGGCAFPISFLLQQQAHLGHHERNRTDLDLYDYYLPHQSKWQRNFLLYSGNLMGCYYLTVVLSNFIYLVASSFYKSTYFKEKIASNLGFESYIEDVSQLPVLQVWGEMLLAFGYQIALIYCLDLTFWGYVLCFYGFALHWSVLQYADHAWSSRDINNGAWNLKVLPPFRWIALNYHYHLAHHQHPAVPWFKLPNYICGQGVQPSFWRVYFLLWKGLRPAPPMGSPADLDFLFPKNKKA